MGFDIIDFAHNICGCDYYIIQSLCRNYMSLHSSTLTTWCIKTTVCSIRYNNCQKIGLLFKLVTYTMLIDIRTESMDKALTLSVIWYSLI